MLIQINTDHNIDGTEKFATYVRSIVENALGRFAEQLTRIEVHLSDSNGAKRGQHDKRCVMEARIEGRQPSAVTHDAATLDLAVHGAAERLERAIESTLDKQKSHHAANHALHLSSRLGS